MAAEYGIEFPLLSDPELTLAGRHAGVSESGYPLPAVFVLKSDGGVYFRHVGEAKDDRVYAARLLAIVDEMTGRRDAPKARGYQHDNQVHAGLAFGGHRLQGERSLAGELELAALHSWGRFLAAGLELGGLGVPAGELRASLLARLRWPLMHGLGEVYLQLPIGLARRFGDDERTRNGVHHGLSAGSSFEASPTLFFYGDLGVETSVFKSRSDDEYASSTRALLTLGAGWKF